VPDLANVLQQAAEAENSVVNVVPSAPCCKRQTLPEFLGVKCLAEGVCGLVNQFRNCLGLRFPGLEATPPLLAITDPANMSADAPPAVQAAADIKAQEDQAAQKIKALRYLASIGCAGCYPDVEDALIASMDDCTEAVRYEAVVAVRVTAEGGGCCCSCSCSGGCNTFACCSEKMQKKLKELAYGKEGSCNKESSARVRRQARLALAACGPPVVYDQPQEPEPVEGPTEGPSEGPAEGTDAVPPPAPGPAQDGAEATDRVTSTTRTRRIRTAEVLTQPSTVKPEQSQTNGYPLEPLPPVLPIFP
jgi:hypothetical protein